MIQELSCDEICLAAMLQSLDNPVRFRIMQYLADHPVCITGDIVEFTTLASSTVSQLFKVLRGAVLIEGEIEGPATCYCISTEGMQFLKSRVEKWLPNCCPVQPSPSQIEGSSQSGASTVRSG